MLDYLILPAQDDERWDPIHPDCSVRAFIPLASSIKESDNFIDPDGSAISHFCRSFCFLDIVSQKKSCLFSQRAFLTGYYDPDYLGRTTASMT